MLCSTVVFLIIALMAGLMRFGEIAAAFAGLAKIVCVIFLVLFLVSLVMHPGRRVRRDAGFGLA